MTPKIADVGLSRTFGKHQFFTGSKKVCLSSLHWPDISNFNTIFFHQIYQFTTNWAPPEAFVEPMILTMKSDIYSFAMIIWEVLTGQIPWFQFQQTSHLIPIKVLKGFVLIKHNNNSNN